MTLGHHRDCFSDLVRDEAVVVRMMSQVINVMTMSFFCIIYLSVQQDINPFTITPSSYHQALIESSSSPHNKANKVYVYSN